MTMLIYLIISLVLAVLPLLVRTERMTNIIAALFFAIQVAGIALVIGLGRVDVVMLSIFRADSMALLFHALMTVVLGFSLLHSSSYLKALARYARGKDYHDEMKERLQKILHSIAELTGNAAPGRAFCDTAPVDEHYWAWRTGLGWLGRNTQLIIPQAGSYYFIGTLILTEPIDRYDRPQPNRCGTCTRCLEACPTGALTEKGIDARRCLSYLTIEHRGALPDFAQKALRNDATTPLCFYGCDRCQDVCPHNRFAMPTSCEAFRPSPALLHQTADDWRHLTVETYRTLFKGSAVKRAKYEGLLRNIAALNENNEGDALT